MKNKYMKNFILTKDKYGDWCVPPEDLKMIKSQDSTRTTNGQLLATAYYYRLLEIMQSFATLSGNNGDVAEYKKLKENIRAAFHKKFFKPSQNQYDNGTVTANLLPLYFDMVPENKKRAVFNNIIKKLQADNMHISTGVIGTQWLMRGLTQNGRADAAFTLASNKTYPSWGYMIENGATTIWELWNGNTANPQMNSQNHIMLLGDLLIWLYENIGGIKSDAKDVAFKKIMMKPEAAINGLQFANAAYNSPYGVIKSDWKKQGKVFLWNISIPANSVAIIHVPAKSVEDIMEGNVAALSVEGVQFLYMKDGNAVFEIGSGNYSFKSYIN